MELTKVFGYPPLTPFTYTKSGGMAQHRPTKGDLLMGMEIEIEGLPWTLEQISGRVHPFGCTVTVDNSLRGNNIQRHAGLTRDLTVGNAFEVLTKPMSQATMLEMLPRIMRAMEATEANHESGRTSIHVHVNCQDRNIQFLKNLFLVYSVVERVLFRFVGHDREGSNFCVPLHSTYAPANTIATLDKSIISIGRHWNKYTALNYAPLSQHGTVEFRHMHGTADVNKLSMWINLLGNLFTKAETEQGKLEEEVYSLNNTSAYEGFFYDIFQGILPYTGEFQELLELGVLNAKHSKLQTLVTQPTIGSKKIPGAADIQWRPLYDDRRAAPEVQQAPVQPAVPLHRDTNYLRQQLLAAESPILRRYFQQMLDEALLREEQNAPPAPQVVQGVNPLQQAPVQPAPAVRPRTPRAPRRG